MMGFCGRFTERRLNVGALLMFFVITYVLNSFWYMSNYYQGDNYRRPPATWDRYLRNAYNMSALNATDFETLVNLTDFRFLINNERCRDAPDLFMVIFVHSAPANFEKRRAIRETWGRESNLVDSEVRLVFLVGTVSNDSLQESLEVENREHSDLVQGNFVDTYRNLTYKHVMGLKWVTYFCRQARFVLKTDDDIFVDTFQLAGYLKGYRGPGTNYPRDLMMCFLINNPNVKRTEPSKWRVSFQEYPHKYYPPYCSGWGIVMSPDVVFNLYLQSPQVPYFWVDDVHVSGVLAKRIGVTHVDFTPKLDITDDDIQNWLDDSTLVRPRLFGHPDSDVNTIYALWNKTIKYYDQLNKFVRR